MKISTCAPDSVTINKIDPDPSQGAIEIPIDMIDAFSLVSQTYSDRDALNRTPSEFIIIGRGELSPSSTDQLGASSTLPHWIAHNNSTSQSAPLRS
ncbi:MAG: hypothetical protein KME11_21950 [Timaviella obliquedivisa GSE-PSE-MK23-08B]|jgi:large exoprotein involved in heme utilization and adhesion|nr:hypothetical protein [Timaviella obliquedivisa GSE-PSE-MK23-08B]